MCRSRGHGTVDVVGDLGDAASCAPEALDATPVPFRTWAERNAQAFRR